MGSRKRSKPNPKPDSVAEPPEDRSSIASEASQPPLERTEQEKVSSDSTPGREVEAGEGPPAKAQGGEDGEKSSSTQSWYAGTWPRISKAAPVTQVVRESIGASSSSSNPKAPLFRTQTRPNTPGKAQRVSKKPSMYLGQGPSASNHSLPLAATTTKVNATPRSSSTPRKPEEPGLNGAPVADGTGDASHPSDRNELGASNPAVDIVRQTPQARDAGSTTGATLSWRGWWPRGGATSMEEPMRERVPITTNETPVPVKDKGQKKTEDASQSAEVDSFGCKAQPVQEGEPSTSDQQHKSWFDFWSGSAAGAKATLNDAVLGDSKASSKATSKADNRATIKPSIPPSQPEEPNESVPSTAQEESTVSPMPPKSSTWAFWSKDSSSSTKTSPHASQTNVGELAIARSPSESHPEPVNWKNVGEGSDSTPTKPSKRERPKSLEDVDAEPRPKTATDSGELTSQKAVSSAPKPSETASKLLTHKLLPPNLLLPSFKSTFQMLENPSILQQIARVLLQRKMAPVKHVNLIKEPPRIKKALAIGIHGYFPAPLVRTVLGQPTGTSVRFANYAADAIRRWTKERGYSCEIEKVALEGEGKIAERIDSLWKLLLNWIDHIQKADFIMVACHSQGVPVGMILVAKLIEFGCINAARVGFCGMAGVNLGPFPDYKSRLFSGSAGELFEFSKPQSVVSQRYEDALRIAVKYGVRILYVGSIDDQLVSLESSTFSTINHPYIYRAVFIDGRIHAPDFIAHLVGFALKLRNLGISDHGLIRELSSPLAGSLYSGEGHSRIYDDTICYDLAVEHALETSPVGDVPLHVQAYDVPSNNNPYILPWSMRGLLEEEYVRTELDHETNELLAQFEEWKPSSKVLKDVKFRLEAVKSKL
ncbi:MAG: hypothetical protein M1833_006835 [Piccolia ochrophora]|nr:MAG: hypothetical protein M1833_006835 [Piccolia ochrophora]